MFSEFTGQVVKVVDEHMVRLAGTRGVSSWTGDGGPALAATFSRPEGLDFDQSGNVLVADSFNCSVRRIDGGTGMIGTVAGQGPFWCGGVVVDGISATSARMTIAEDVAWGANGEFFIADTDNCRIRKVDGAGIISSITLGIPAGGICLNDGDGGPSGQAHIMEPSSLAVGPDGSLYFNSGCVLRRIEAGVISTVSFTGNLCASGADFAIGPGGEILISNGCHLDVIADGVLTTVAGYGAMCFVSGRGGQAIQATLRTISAVAVDSAGNVFVADFDERDYSQPMLISVIYGAAVDSDGDGYLDAAEAGIGEDPYTYCKIIRADVNRDGTVNSGDQLRVVLEQFHPSTLRFDQNGDGQVNSGDVLAVRMQFGQPVSACP
ncbi:MAG: hypothetical protein HY873_06410 [Chloroflexi bacterium]|nr:hypothetical protein [Chloroflexota bacterium]